MKELHSRHDGADAKTVPHRIMATCYVRGVRTEHASSAFGATAPAFPFTRGGKGPPRAKGTCVVKAERALGASWKAGRDRERKSRTAWQQSTDSPPAQPGDQRGSLYTWWERFIGSGCGVVWAQSWWPGNIWGDVPCLYQVGGHYPREVFLVFRCGLFVVNRLADTGREGPDRGRLSTSLTCAESISPRFYFLTRGDMDGPANTAAGSS